VADVAFDAPARARAGARARRGARGPRCGGRTRGPRCAERSDAQLHDGTFVADLRCSWSAFVRSAFPTCGSSTFRRAAGRSVRWRYNRVWNRKPALVLSPSTLDHARCSPSEPRSYAAETFGSRGAPTPPVRRSRRREGPRGPL